jgi:hypothetical protein
MFKLSKLYNVSIHCTINYIYKFTCVYLSKGVNILILWPFFYKIIEGLID